MSAPAIDTSRLAGSGASGSGASVIRELQERVHRMQGTAVSHPVETLPALRPLVQLRTGASYATDSPVLAMAMMAGPSSAGAWCGVVGDPDFGVEAAAALGVEPDRTVLIPEPGEDWLNVTAAMVDVLSVVLVRPPASVTAHQAARLSARLRQRDAVLIALGDWPRCEARLRVRRTRWSGIGQGHGHLSARRMEVVARHVGSPSVEAELWLPDAEAKITTVQRFADPQPAFGEGGRRGLRVVEAG